MTPEVDRATVAIMTVGSRGRPRFLATAAPTLAWRVETARPGWIQAEAEVRSTHDGRAATARLDGSASAAVPWPFDALSAYDTRTVEVRVRGEGEQWGPFSPPVTVETGPLGPADVHGFFVTAPDAPAPRPELDAPRPAFIAAREFDVGPGLQRAVLTSTARGIYDVAINGSATSDEVLAPGWTAYGDRLLFQTHDVTHLLREGTNVVVAEVADGWFAERYGFDGDFSKAYEGPIAYLAQLRLEYAHGECELVVTDETWRATWNGPTTSASIYQGERRDERVATAALDSAALSACDATAVVIDANRQTIAPAFAPPVRRVDALPAASVNWNGVAAMVDFGQNLAGWVRLRARAPEGTVVTIRHAEVLDDGALATRPLRHAAATDSVTVGPTGEVDFAPRFTFHGFRYAEITGLPSPNALTSVEAVVVHNDMVRTGQWECSDPLLNRLHENVVWGMRSNFLSIPTDCPQRDERLGWTGDIQVFAPTAAFLYDCGAMLQSWLIDLEHEQRKLGGVVPSIVPLPVSAGPALPAAGWGDAAVGVPAALHLALGDATVLDQQYASMEAWVGAVLYAAGDSGLWEGGFQFGDWLDPTAPPFNPADAKADADVVATACLFRSLSELAHAAAVTGRSREAERWRRLAQRTQDAFLAAYVTPAGRLMSDAQTAYAIAIAFGLLDNDPRRQAAGDRLAALVRAHAYRIRTGFIGTPVICDALSATGHRDVAYRLLLEEGCPSWLYPVTMGATTVWERWDSMAPDGSINPGEMTSFNHYALGAVADWMHREITGLRPTAPGYRRFTVAPRPGGGLAHAAAKLETTYGAIEVAWRTADSMLMVDVTVPANTRAVIDLPGSAPEEVGSGLHVRSTPWVAETAVPERITLDTTLAVLVDDAPAAAAVQTVFAQTGYFIGLGWNDGGKWRTDYTLRNGLPMLKGHQHLALSRALSTVNAERGFAAIPGEWDLTGMPQP